MLGYTTIGTNELASFIKFYDTLFAKINAGSLYPFAEGLGYLGNS